MLKRIALGAMLAAAAAGAQRPTYQTKGTGTVVLRAARVWDGTGAPPLQNGVVVVTDDRIAAVGRDGAVSVPAGARVIDLGDATLLPGFIDMHVHIIGRTLGDPAQNAASVRDNPAFGAILLLAVSSHSISSIRISERWPARQGNATWSCVSLRNVMENCPSRRRTITTLSRRSIGLPGLSRRLANRMLG